MTTRAILEWIPGMKTEEAIAFLDRERPAHPQPAPGLRDLVTVDFVDAVESIATRYRDSGQCTFYATVTELLDSLPAIRDALAQSEREGK